MKKKQILIIILILNFILYTVSCEQRSVSDTQEVYICTGRYSKAYHKNKSCKGIKWCKRKVKKVTVKEARVIYNRHQCSHCF